ncbi:hypothetical protein NE237_010721 [Protea cynaroides]|uniref:Purple acid phosphatase n=1 Tax=Protea cynaroides TaxID=273540 RepID=A0A9Q0L158_9MAGN|nr:hypothetical protein NE237_010721 [Protea cynaroides]
MQQSKFNIRNLFQRSEIFINKVLVSGDKTPQEVLYGDGKSKIPLPAKAEVATFTPKDMCNGKTNVSDCPASTFGWHDPGFIHSAVMTNLGPSTTYFYSYGSKIKFKTPPAGGSDELKFISYGDMGKAPLDPSSEHYIQPGSTSVMAAIAKEVDAGNVDLIFHSGDISYATGFLVEWDYFLQHISPAASHVPYMIAIGNHERDCPDSGSVYGLWDSGGENKVPYETYFPMPTSAKDKPWLTRTHFVECGLRPMYSSSPSTFTPNTDPNFTASVEPVLVANKVDDWSLVRISEFGYARVHATKNELNIEDQMEVEILSSGSSVYSTSKLHDYKSDFRVLNRRILAECSNGTTNIQIKVSSKSASGLLNEEYVKVTVSGVSDPSNNDWIAMITPSGSDNDTKACLQDDWNYMQTGDMSNLPLLCHYPIKGQNMNEDPNYMNCKKEGNKSNCSGTLSFHVVNIRTDIEFVLFGNGFINPCVLKRSGPIKFANPNAALYGHLSSVNSSGTSVSGDKTPQGVLYGDGKSNITLLANSKIATFTPKDMCNGKTNVSDCPASNFGWHDPGFIHSAVMTNLSPSTTYFYSYGSSSVGWSNRIKFRTPPAEGSDELKFISYGDMGKAPLDPSSEHYIQPGSTSVMAAIAKEVDAGNVDSIFHIGDISYATGFLVEWDYFLQHISPAASHVPYMTAIGNHERDYPDSGSVYGLWDSGGEIGVPYETYFPMPTSAKDKPWYSIKQGPVHFTVVSTEHNFSCNSEQNDWIKWDLRSVDRSVTPWVIFMGHRPMYSSSPSTFTPNTDPNFTASVEPVLVANKVDLVLFGHVHNYERTCSINEGTCKATPLRDGKGIDTYDHNNYKAPVHAIIGMAGFMLDDFNATVDDWSLVRISEFGYARVHATKKQLDIEFVNVNTTKVEDAFRIIKS